MDGIRTLPLQQTTVGQTTPPFSLPVNVDGVIHDTCDYI